MRIYGGQSLTSPPLEVVVSVAAIYAVTTMITFIRFVVDRASRPDARKVALVPRPKLPKSAMIDGSSIEAKALL